MIKLKGIGHKYLSLLSRENISTVEKLRKLEPESLECTPPPSNHATRS
jgi:hypothetical protein